MAAYFKFKVLLFVAVLCCIACSSDDYVELSGNYFYRGEGEHTKQIISHSPKRSSIYSDVVDYDYNDDFIVAKQIPVYDDYVNMIGAELRVADVKKYPTNSTKEQEWNEAEADSILKHNPYYRSIFKNHINYWIIAHKHNKLYGPFTRPEYLNMRYKLGVPDNVSIEF